jgi:hypothetical protein
VPVAIDRISLAAHKSSNSLSAQATAFSKPTTLVGRITAVDSDGVVFSCNGVTMVPFREVQADEKEDTIAGARIEWKPDVDFVEFEKTELDLRGLLELLGHKTPTLRMLCVAGEDMLGTAVMVLSELSLLSGRKYGSFTFAAENSSRFEETKEKLKDFEPIECQILGLKNEPFEQGLPPNGFDLIIIPSSIFRNKPAAVPGLRKLLQSDGRLLLQVPLSCNMDVSVSSLDQELRSTGFHRIVGVIHQSYSSNDAAYIFTCPSRVLAAPVASRITLIYRGRDSPEPPKVLEISKQLSESGYGIDLRTFQQTLPLDQDIISLLDIEHPFLDMISETDFGIFKEIIKRVGTRNVVWVTRSAQSGRPKIWLISRAY